MRKLALYLLRNAVSDYCYKDKTTTAEFLITEILYVLTAQRGDYNTNIYDLHLECTVPVQISAGTSTGKTLHTVFLSSFRGLVE